MPFSTVRRVFDAQVTLLPLASGPTTETDTSNAPTVGMPSPNAEYAHVTVSPALSVTPPAPSSDASPLTNSCQYFPVAWSQPSASPV